MTAHPFNQMSTKDSISSPTHHHHHPTQLTEDVTPDLTETRQHRTVQHEPPNGYTDMNLNELPPVGQCTTPVERNDLAD
ncbi:hypothetical protein N7537_004428 [Penicillium hordei]|uniref:Uncharacterized protein n=1 Tax=Penicillium hordei TaxID=40994 RepID=A0AAD6EBH9_9EURO|nr:uncharacterized protein N7537_004428 [Penicillium hordei]KAJ5607809.1 hypothetical protein N7537_004428 [Penicillium hordei]